MKKYLLFDMDGTLTDSGPGITRSVQYALKSFGIEEPDLKNLEKFIGPPLRDSFKTFYGFDDEKAEAAVWKYRERYAKIGIFENSPYNGIPRMLKNLKKEGFHLAVASSKPQEYVERVLEHFKIKSYFDVIVGGNMDGSRDQKPVIIREVLARFFMGKPPKLEEVYMIGDRKFDVEGAKETGVESVGVSYGFGSVEELLEAKADYVVQSVWELEDFLMREVRANEKAANPGQKIWGILYVFLIFMLVKSAALYAANWFLLFICENTEFPFKQWFVTWDEAGDINGFTGNAATIMSAIGFFAGGFAILKIAEKYIERARIDNRLSFLKPEPRANYLILGFSTIMWVMGLNMLFVLTGIIDRSESYKALERDQYSAAFLVGIVCFGIVSPIAEELLFRGVIYNYLRRFSGTKAAVFLSAAFFGLYHGNMVQGVYAFCMGLLIAYAYEYFGDFKIPALVHIIANIMAYSMAYSPLAKEMAAYAPICAVALGGGIFGISLLHRKKNIL